MSAQCLLSVNYVGRYYHHTCTKGVQGYKCPLVVQRCHCKREKSARHEQRIPNVKHRVAHTIKSARLGEKIASPIIFILKMPYDVKASCKVSRIWRQHYVYKSIARSPHVDILLLDHSSTFTSQVLEPWNIHAITSYSTRGGFLDMQ